MSKKTTIELKEVTEVNVGIYSTKVIIDGEVMYFKWKRSGMEILSYNRNRVMDLTGLLKGYKLLNINRYNMLVEYIGEDCYRVVTESELFRMMDCFLIPNGGGIGKIKFIIDNLPINMFSCLDTTNEGVRQFVLKAYDKIDEKIYTLLSLEMKNGTYITKEADTNRVELIEKYI